MCGIFGIVGAPESTARVRLDEALLALRHRGPDDSGTFESSVGLPGRPPVSCRFAHTRLAILDLTQGGHQPMSTDDGRYTVVFNGEIYNFKDVRRRLRQEGVSFRSESDTEVLLAAYRAKGDRCVDDLRGMFAFAIWDRQEARLFLARDRMGIKPLYYTQHADGTLVFASEVRAFLRTGTAARDVEPRAVVTFLRFGSVYDPLTMVRGVRQIEAGHTMTWCEGRTDTRQYWQVPWGETRPVAQEELKAAFDSAVRLRLIADVPVGVFLSGGMDSTALAAVASAGAGTADLATFTVCFHESEYNEGHFAAEVAARFGCRHHEIHLRDEEVRQQLPAAAAALDQPSADGVNTFVVSKAVRDAGLVVALSGLGGDELFGGYHHFRTIGTLRAATRAIRAAGIVGGPLLSRGSEWSRSSGIRKLLDSAIRSAGAGSTYAAIRGMFTWREVGALLGQPPGALASDSWELRINEATHVAALERDPVNQLSALELTGYLRNTLLRDSDVMSMAHALELRVPFLDHEFIELVARIPGGDKIRAGENKPLLSAIVPELPRDAATRPKHGFVLPFEVWLRGPLRAWAQDVLARTGRAIGLDPDAARDVWDGFLRGRVSWSRVWTLIVLLLWLEENGIE